jgi:molecular chaperone GrpE
MSEKDDPPVPADSPESADVSLPRSEYEDILKRLAELEGIREKLLRSAADFENARKRLTRERDEFAKFAQESILKDILPVLDNLERALSHAGDVQDKAAKGLITGIERVFKQFDEILKNHGLKRLKTLGEKFDPHFHESVGTSPAAGPEGHVAEEIEPGYMLHDRLVRASKVRLYGSHAAEGGTHEEKS